MGDVYELLQPRIGKSLAAKVLHAEFAVRPEIADRFFDEARAVNAIGHPGIIDIFDHGHLSDGRPYLIMELLEGESVADLLGRCGPLPVDRVEDIALQVLDALEAAHSRGIVHRDLKPDNLFVGTDGRAKLLDFGIAKLSASIRSGQVPTRTGELLGTPRYMAPEQASGKVRRIDARTDVYAMGAVLYEMLTGRPPFDSETLPELIEDQLSKTPAPVGELRPDLSAAWQAIVTRAMSKDPDDRFPSAETMAAAIAAGASRAVADSDPRSNGGTAAPGSARAMRAGPDDTTAVAGSARATKLLANPTPLLPADERPTVVETPERPALARRPGLGLPLLGLALAATVIAALLLFR